MKEKISRIFLTASFLLAFCSCDDAFLKEVPRSFLSSNDTYTTKEGVLMGINGLHGYTRTYIFYEDYCRDYRGLRTDVSWCGENPTGSGWTYTGCTPTSGDYEKLWIRAYELVARANEILKYVDSSKGWDSDAERDACKGEALFFRAYGYWFLTSFFGDVPLVTGPVDKASTDYVRDPVADVWKQQVEDLTYAVNHLPGRTAVAAPGRISAGAAENLLSMVYLEMGDWEAAEKTATNVIENYGYALMKERFGSTTDVFGSGDVFLDLFARGNQNLEENTEGIWVIQVDANLRDGTTATSRNDLNGGARRYGPRYFDLGKDPSKKPCFVGLSDSLGRGVAWSRPTWHTHTEIWLSDWDNDIRNAPHNIKRDYYYENPESVWNGKKIDVFHDWPKISEIQLYRDTTNFIFPYIIGKMGDPMAENCNEEGSYASYGYTRKDFYSMRLAETFLNRAEARLHQGNAIGAADDINEVRSRAHANPVAPADVTFDYLLDERIRELFGEEFRDIVLRRIDRHDGLADDQRIFYQRMYRYNDCPGAPGMFMRPYMILWPIPQKEIDATGGRIVQNPGYIK